MTWSRRVVGSVNAVARRAGRLRGAGPGFAASEQALLDGARRATGLTDFGDPGFREGLGVLLRAYDEEARLTPFGAWMTRQQLAGILRARLRVVEGRRRDPACLANPIQRPVFVLGLPRTGTTALHALLASDPACQALEYWLAASPGPRPPRESWERDPRFKEAAFGLRLTYWLDPGLRAIHDLTPEGPDECRHLLGQCFRDDTFDSNATIPSYTAWYRKADMRPAYAWHRDVLRLIGSGQTTSLGSASLRVGGPGGPPPRGPERRWLLKYPAHLAHLETLLDTYPDACIVQTHRDPARVLPSLCSLVTNWRGIYEDGVDVQAVARWQVEMWAERLEHALAVRERCAPGRFFDLHFREIVEDPVVAARRVHAHFGLPWTDEGERAMTAWHAAHPPGRHGAHRYDAGRFGLSAGAIQERFRAYTRRFGVPAEGDPS
jgi:hypothetical protein